MGKEILVEKITCKDDQTITFFRFPSPKRSLIFFPDEESMYEHLSPMYVEGLKRIIEIDKRNMRIFEEFYSKTSVSTTREDTIDPAIIGFLAEIVPIFAESKSCIVESLAVINALVNNHTWPILSKLTS